MINRQFKIVLLFCLLSFSAKTQEINKIGITPFIKYFPPEEYKGAPTNFFITQDDNGILYFANQNGSVLIFDGEHWKNVKVSSNVHVSCVKVIKNKIFVGGYGFIGTLETKNGKDFVFKSYNELIPPNDRNFTNVSEIYSLDSSTVIFHTQERLYILRNNKIKVLNVSDYFHQGLFLTTFKVQQKLFVYVKYKGIYEFQNDSLVFVNNTEQLGNLFVRSIIHHNNGLIIGTYLDGFYFFKNGILTKLTTSIDNYVRVNLFSASKITDKYFLIVLKSGGVIIVDSNFNLYQFFKTSYLVSDRILNAFVDNSKNIWLATENGIQLINPFSPFTVIDKRFGLDAGTKVFKAVFWKDHLLLGTNRGIYYTPWKEDINNYNLNFKYLFNSQFGTFSVYNFLKLSDKVFVCSEAGLFYLDLKNDSLRLEPILLFRSIIDATICPTDTTTLWAISSALFAFKKIKNKWNLVIDDPKIKGHNILIDGKHLWISNFYKYLALFEIDFNTNSYKNLFTIDSTNYREFGLPTYENIRFFRLKEKLVFATLKGAYLFDYQSKKFYPDYQLNDLLGKNTNLNIIVEDADGDYWYKKQEEKSGQVNWYLCMIEKKSQKPCCEPFYLLKNNIYSINAIDNFSVLIGTDYGAALIDKRIKFSLQPFKTQISRVEISKNIDSVVYSFVENSYIDQVGPQQIPIILKHKYNNLRFYFAGQYFSNLGPLYYSYMLEGYDANWSNWTKETYKDYSNLPAGNYVFRVKSKNIYGQVGEEAKFYFIIKPPFYQTFGAYILYVLILGILIYVIVRLYTYRLRLQKKYLEEQVRLRTIEIEKQKEQIEQQRDLLYKQNIEIQKINKDLTSSIEYAQRIQSAILPDEKYISKFFDDHFILFLPRDIVSGDFYWFYQKDNFIIYSAIDCTGHGVPGAFMSLIGSKILTTIVQIKKIYEPDEILKELNKDIISTLNQENTETQDGMDMALCKIELDKKIVKFAGAKNPLYVIYNNELTIYKASKQSIGGFQFSDFSKEVIEYKSPTYFYMFSDGYADQFGDGDKGKFMVSRFKNLLLEIYKLPMQEQKQILHQRLRQWQGQNYQTDDILVIGFKL